MGMHQMLFFPWSWRNKMSQCSGYKQTDWVEGIKFGEGKYGVVHQVTKVGGDPNKKFVKKITKSPQGP